MPLHPVAGTGNHVQMSLFCVPLRLSHFLEAGCFYRPSGRTTTERGANMAADAASRDRSWKIRGAWWSLKTQKWPRTRIIFCYTDAHDLWAVGEWYIFLRIVVCKSSSCDGIIARPHYAYSSRAVYGQVAVYRKGALFCRFLAHAVCNVAEHFNVKNRCNTFTKIAPCFITYIFTWVWWTKGIGRYTVCDVTNHLNNDNNNNNRCELTDLKYICLNLCSCAMIVLRRLHSVHTLITMYTISTLFFHTLVTC